MTAHTETLTAEEHRTAAQTFLARAGAPGLAAEGATAYAAQAIAHALLAAAPVPLEPVQGTAARQRLGVEGWAVLALLCAVVLAAVWLLTR